jgi:hypothetical protein
MSSPISYSLTLRRYIEELTIVPWDVVLGKAIRISSVGVEGLRKVVPRTFLLMPVGMNLPFATR